MELNRSISVFLSSMPFFRLTLNLPSIRMFLRRRWYLFQRNIFDYNTKHSPSVSMFKKNSLLFWDALYLHIYHFLLPHPSHPFLCCSLSFHRNIPIFCHMNIYIGHKIIAQLKSDHYACCIIISISIFGIKFRTRFGNATIIMHINNINLSTSGPKRKVKIERWLENSTNRYCDGDMDAHGRVFSIGFIAVELAWPSLWCWLTSPPPPTSSSASLAMLKIHETNACRLHAPIFIYKFYFDCTSICVNVKSKSSLITNHMHTHTKFPYSEINKYQKQTQAHTHKSQSW